MVKKLIKYEIRIKEVYYLSEIFDDVIDLIIEQRFINYLVWIDKFFVLDFIFDGRFWNFVDNICFFYIFQIFIFIFYSMFFFGGYRLFYRYFVFVQNLRSCDQLKV